MISIHATHTGGDLGSGFDTRRCLDFNPRHPYGWRPSSGRLTRLTPQFQSTPPIRVATRPDWCREPFPDISIHATHTGGDFYAASFFYSDVVFQSTPPIRVATRFRRYRLPQPGISIHATHTGGDEMITAILQHKEISIHATHTGGDYDMEKERTGENISIHATHTGGDGHTTKQRTIHSDFNPRHPYGWRRRQGCWLLAWRYFNPRHPYGWRLVTHNAYYRTLKFQSTPPIRVATIDASGFGTFLQFQSTPPIRVATRLRYSRFCFGSDFNPRHPYGWRHDIVEGKERNDEISIHATHTGGDVDRGEVGDFPASFQSTPPIRVATISAVRSMESATFQSTPPIRVATRRFRRVRQRSQDFNPRHPYGWRHAFF